MINKVYKQWEEKNKAEAVAMATMDVDDKHAGYIAPMRIMFN